MENREHPPERKCCHPPVCVLLLNLVRTKPMILHHASNCLGTVPITMRVCHWHRLPHRDTLQQRNKPVCASIRQGDGPKRCIPYLEFRCKVAARNVSLLHNLIRTELTNWIKEAKVCGPSVLPVMGHNKPMINIVRGLQILMLLYFLRTPVCVQPPCIS